ncbi:DUF3558 family protein [Actinomadura rubrisoli]|uniref:DUF3558 family protein n=1 Tax=Actinomadura rubrisoli TaxID=2530368 RepID=UPI001404739E|nr:DUF3558 family protein [Actinomadura rubrisoli]
MTPKNTVAAVGCLLALLGGCGSGAEPDSKPTSTSPSTSGTALPAALPHRPRELRVDGIHSCDLLPKAQWAAFSIVGATKEPPEDDIPENCRFDVSSDSYTYDVTVYADQGVSLTVKGKPRIFTRLADVGGFAATVTDPPLATASHCLVQLDVAEKQHVDVAITGSEYEQEVREGGCEKVIAMAGIVLNTLQTLRR